MPCRAKLGGGQRTHCCQTCAKRGSDFIQRTLPSGAQCCRNLVLSRSRGYHRHSPGVYLERTRKAEHGAGKILATFRAPPQSGNDRKSAECTAKHGRRAVVRSDTRFARHWEEPCDWVDEKVNGRRPRVGTRRAVRMLSIPECYGRSDKRQYYSSLERYSASC